MKKSAKLVKLSLAVTLYYMLYPLLKTMLSSSTDMAKTVNRLVWAKLINLGQTCIAPDYLLCTKEIQDEFVAAFKERVK